MTNHWLMLCGQSNMAGQGMWGNQFSPISNGGLVDSHSGEFTGPGAAYIADWAQDHPTLDLYGIMAAVGGTSIDEWIPGGDMFSGMLQKWTAQGSPSIEKILFMQGEYEGLSGNLDVANAWASKFALFVSGVRDGSVFGAIPIIVVAIGPNPGSVGSDVYNSWLSVQSQQENLSYPSLTVVKSKDLSLSDDWIHFDKSSYWTIGSRLYGSNL